MVEGLVDLFLDHLLLSEFHKVIDLKCLTFCYQILFPFYIDRLLCSKLFNGFIKFFGLTCLVEVNLCLCLFILFDFKISSSTSICFVDLI